jgi:hypothetical protein
MVHGLPCTHKPLELCEACILGKKMCEKLLKGKVWCAKLVLEPINIDLCGPISQPFIGEKLYLKTFIVD